MAGADGDALAPGGAAAAEYGGTSIGLHARPEAVRFCTVAAVGLKCTFGHGYPLLFLKKNLQLSSIFKYIAGGFMNPVEERTSRCGKGDARSKLCLKSAANLK
jgi:hypothetical protein